MILLDFREYGVYASSMLFGFLGADLDYLTSVVVWGRAKEDVMLLVRKTEDKHWVVSISRGSSKMEYILNS